MTQSLYLAQCIAGLQEFVAWQLLQDFPAAEIKTTEEGMVVFAGDETFLSAKIPYINNLFHVLQDLPKNNMNGLLTACAKQTSWHKAAASLPDSRDRTFRLFLSDENRLVSGDPPRFSALIKIIERVSGLRHSAHRPDAEFWIFRRRSGSAYFGRRLTRNRMTEKDLAPGTLRPELATLLCLISEPSEKDIFMDPFAGSGAIAFARKKWPYEMMFVTDIAPEKVKTIKDTIAARKKPIITRVADATKLEKIEDGFIDKVVTDPPWGIFEKDIADVPGFYKKTIKELCRVTKPGGIIVMLTGVRELVADLSKQFSKEVDVEARFDILVAGKKASIVRWRRK